MAGERVLFRGIGGILCAIATLSQAGADPLPTRVGQCSQTEVTWLGTRLTDTPGSGSAVGFANGGRQVWYETLPQITRSRVGDPVTMCLVAIPPDCPPGDNRGRVYQTTNQRTRQSWRLPDSEHRCGGA